MKMNKGFKNLIKSNIDIAMQKEIEQAQAKFKME